MSSEAARAAVVGEDRLDEMLRVVHVSCVYDSLAKRRLVAHHLPFVLLNSANSFLLKLIHVRIAVEFDSCGRPSKHFELKNGSEKQLI